MVNGSTPIGFCVTICVELVSFMITCHTAVCALALLIAIFGMLMAFGFDILRRFEAFNRIITVDKNHFQEELYMAIRLHTDIMELSIQFD